jgi:hypothetical protein
MPSFLLNHFAKVVRGDDTVKVRYAAASYYPSNTVFNIGPFKASLRSLNIGTVGRSL